MESSDMGIVRRIRPSIDLNNISVKSIDRIVHDDRIITFLAVAKIETERSMRRPPAAKHRRRGWVLI
jgi:hypothetical protein